MKLPRPERLLQAGKFLVVIAAETALFPIVVGASRLAPAASDDILRLQNRLRACALAWLQPHLRAARQKTRPSPHS